MWCDNVEVHHKAAFTTLKMRESVNFMLTWQSMVTCSVNFK